MRPRGPSMQRRGADETGGTELAKKQTLRDQIAELQAQLQQAEKTGKPKKIKAAKTSPKAAKPRTSNGGGGASVSRPKHVHSHSTSSAGHRPRKSISYRDDDFDYDGSDDNYGGGGRTGSKARGGADGDDDYDIISYEQKKELATRIQDAQEPMQTHAINVIKQNRPDLVSVSTTHSFHHDGELSCGRVIGGWGGDRARH